jgi:hypothetical protein
MSNENFIDYALKLVRQYTEEHLDKSDPEARNDFIVYPVWLSKVLQNNKGLFSTSLFDGMYYEVTYNGDKDEIYLDAYKKFENRKIERINNTFRVC